MRSEMPKEEIFEIVRAAMTTSVQAMGNTPPQVPGSITRMNGRSPGSRVVGFFLRLPEAGNRHPVATLVMKPKFAEPSPPYSRGVGCDKGARIGSARRIPFSSQVF